MENEIQPNIPPSQSLPQTPPIIPPPTNWSKILLFTLLGLIVVAGSIFIGIQIGKTQTPNQQPIVAQPTASPTQTAVNPTADWKTLILEKIQFKYPPDWKNPEYIQTPSGQSAEIKNNDNTQRVIVLTGINKGYSKDDLSGFINSLIEGGAKRMTLDNSEAAESKVVYQGSKISTVYVTSQDNTSQYSITLQVPEAYSDQEMGILLNQILSTFKFTN